MDLQPTTDHSNAIPPAPGDAIVALMSAAGGGGGGKRSRSSPGRKRKLRVMLVDESETSSLLISSKLAKIDGVKIVGAVHDGPSVASRVKRFQGHVVILDPVLKGLDSIEVLAELKKRPQPAQVILYSSIDQPDLRKKCFDAGADYFFGKENDYPALCSVLRHLARKVADQAPTRSGLNQATGND